MDLQEFDKMFAVEETNWWYRGRRQLVRRHMERLHTECGRLSVLDLACATGMNFRAFSDLADLWGVDISEETVRLCGARGINRIIRADAMKLPFRDETFDLVLALDSLEHFEDDCVAIDEMARVTKAGGRALVTVPAFMFLWSDHDVAYHHFRRYTARELRRKLSERFDILKLSYYSMTLLPPVYAMRKLRSGKNSAHSDFFIKLPLPIEWSLSAIMKTELALLRAVNLPFGVSLFCEARKRE